MSPQAVSTATFRTVKKGYDPDEVATFLVGVAGELEQLNDRSTAMEARARAALAKLQEATQAANATPPGTKMPVLGVDEAETISRTLLLAQRTADTTVAEAEAEAEAIRATASAEVAKAVDAAREQATRLVDEARAEARRAGESERIRVEGEVQSLLARREFLLSDVNHLEEFVVEQRHRLLAVAELIQDMAERGASGLGDIRPPLLSAAGEVTRREPDPQPQPEPESEPQSELESELESEPERTAQAEVVEAEPEPEFDPEASSEPETATALELSSEPDAEPEPDAGGHDATPVASSKLPGLDLDGEPPTGQVPSVAGSDGGLRFRTDI